VKTIALGIAQGLTEFLPVSSSGHLFIIKRLTHLSDNLIPFFVLLHLATLLAIVIFLRRQIVKLLFRKKTFFNLTIITATTAIIGLVIDRFLVNFFESRFFISFFLLINAAILLSLKKTSGKKHHHEIKFKDALSLGLLQGLSVLPGISRSGITISSLLRKGFAPQEAFTFSFLMAIPAILGAFFLKARELTELKIVPINLLGGFFAAFLSGLLALFIVNKTLKNQKFSFFGYYCILISLVSLLI